jgi:nucleolin
LSWGIDDDNLYKAFETFEGLVGARVVYDKHTGRSKGFGYVDFSTGEQAKVAYEAMNGQDLDGRTLNLDYANTRPTDSTPQARAFDRAQKHGDTVSPESDTLFVGNLPFGVDQDTVREFFSECREVVSVRLPTNP